MSERELVRETGGRGGLEVMKNSTSFGGCVVVVSAAAAAVAVTTPSEKNEKK